MTCIVGYVDNNTVWMGGDSAGVSSNLDLQLRKDKKVFIKDDFIFGFTSSFRMGQLIQYKLNIPKIKQDQDIDDYIYTDFIDAVIECFEDNKFATITNNEIEGGWFLFGFKGKLYNVQTDFQVAKTFDNFNAIGCGESFALGALYAMELGSPLTPEQRVKTALESAEQYSAGVRSPFNIIKL